jgi:hypothetical protein
MDDRRIQQLLFELQHLRAAALQPSTNASRPSSCSVKSSAK